MKYAIYDKAADGYLTRMEFDTGDADNQMLTSTGYTEYITEARLLDTPKEAADAIVRIESCKFMDKGRFVMHSFNDTLKDQYIISEAGEPTKVVDNITVDLEGNINVKYGTMVSHWSATSLIYVINKLNRLQDASAPTRYSSWNATFDIYKVITVIDENGHNHYQFINVTDKGIISAKKEANSLNKRIEELEKANDASKDIANNIVDICEADDEFDVTLKKFSELYNAVKRNIANHELKNDEIAKLSEKIEKLKSQFNSMYGYYDTDDAAIDYCLHDVMITGGRCCGKQVMADILSGKKIPISKDKYDSILTSLKLIDLSYEGVYGTTIRISPKPKPTWLSGLMTEIKNLTK